MSERGFVAVDRGLFDHPIFTDEPKTEREAWVWIIANACWAPQQKRIGSQVLDLKRGQLGCSLRFLAKAWMWNDSRVRRFIGKLQAAQMIDAVSTQMATQITVCNYDVYQQSRRSSDAAPDAVATQTRTKKQTTTTSSEANASSSVAPASDDAQAAFDAWNDTARRNDLPVAEKLTKDRRSKLTARIADAGGLDGWFRALDRLEASDFCTGRKTDFRSNLDFVLQASSFLKLIEGSYDNNRNQRGQHEQRHSHAQRGQSALDHHLNNIVARSEFSEPQFEDREGPRWPSDGVPRRELSLVGGTGGSYGLDRSGPVRATGGRYTG